MKVVNGYKMSEEELKEARANSTAATRILEAASIQLQRSRPFYGIMIASMPVHDATQWLSTVATDGRTFYYSVEFIAGMTEKRRAIVDARIDNMKGSPKKKRRMKRQLDIWFRPKTAREVVFLFEHEIRHITNDHIFRGKNYIHDLFNAAADQGINTGLVIEHSKKSAIGSAWFPMAEKTVFNPDEEFGFMSLCYCDFKYLNMATEEIYHKMLRKQKEEEKQATAKPQSPQQATAPAPNPAGVGPEDDEQETEQDEDESESPLPSNTPPADDDDFEEDDFDDSDYNPIIPHDAHMEDGKKEEGENSDPEDDEFTVKDLDDALGIDSATAPSKSPEEREEDAGVMRRNIEVAVAHGGEDAPKEARDWVSDGDQIAKVNYLVLLRRTLATLRKGGLTYKRPSKRSWSVTRSLRGKGYITRRQTVVIPGKKDRKTIRVWIGFDVSGSFTDDLLFKVKQEVAGLVRQYDEFEIVLFCWSTFVGHVIKYDKGNAKEMIDYKIQTSGGTDVFCVFNKLDELEEEVDQLIIFTDGEFRSPADEKDWSKKYGKKTIWVRMGGLSRMHWEQPFGKLIEFDELV